MLVLNSRVNKCQCRTQLSRNYDGHLPISWHLSVTTLSKRWSMRWMGPIWNESTVAAARQQRRSSISKLRRNKTHHHHPKIQTLLLLHIPLWLALSTLLSGTTMPYRNGLYYTIPMWLNFGHAVHYAIVWFAVSIRKQVAIDQTLSRNMSRFCMQRRFGSRQVRLTPNTCGALPIQSAEALISWICLSMLLSMARKQQRPLDPNGSRKMTKSHHQPTRTLLKEICSVPLL